MAGMERGELLNSVMFTEIYTESAWVKWNVPAPSP